jgi:long-chain-fatty-acid--CoA ligase ACSBG
MCPIVNNIMVVGDYQKYLSAIITLKVEVDAATGVPSTHLTNEAKGILKRDLNIDNIKTAEEAMSNQVILKYIQTCVDKANEKSISRAAFIRKWKLIPTDFSLPGGEFTPTLKLRRKATELKYK